MTDYIYLYPKWLRAWHQVNALMFLILIITGLSMQYGLFKIPFNVAVSIHNICGIILACSYLIFLIGNLTSGNYKYYLIKIEGFYRDLKLQFKFYTSGLFKSEKPPFPINKGRKFNPLQKLSYILVMAVIVPVIVLSGLSLLFPQVIINRILGVPGIVVADLLHITAGFLGSIFMLIHIYFCTIGSKPAANFKSMITGYHEIEN